MISTRIATDLELSRACWVRGGSTEPAQTDQDLLLHLKVAQRVQRDDASSGPPKCVEAALPRGVTVGCTEEMLDDLHRHSDAVDDRVAGLESPAIMILLPVVLSVLTIVGHSILGRPRKGPARPASNCSGSAELPPTKRKI